MKIELELDVPEGYASTGEYRTPEKAVSTPVKRQKNVLAT